MPTAVAKRPGAAEFSPIAMAEVLAEDALLPRAIEPEELAEAE